MKRVLATVSFVLVLVIAAGGPVFAQSDEIAGLEVFSSGFESFSEEFTKSLPMNSAIGLNWSDAYVGQLLPIPSLGVGVTAGVTTIPSAAFDDLISDLGVEVSGGISDLSAVGLALPGYAFDARVGGLVLPFDVGLKFGTIGQIDLGDVEAEYTNFGVDLRYAVLDGGVLPKLSIGVGYNRLSGRVATPFDPSTTRVASVSDGSTTYDLLLSDPQLEMEWTANVFDVKAQLSKSFLIVEPHIGLAASFGSAETTSGLNADVVVVDDGTTNPAAGVTAADIEDAFGVGVTETGLGLDTDATTFAVRAFGGASLNLTVFRLDLGVMYNLTSGAMGGTLGARFQI